MSSSTPGQSNPGQAEHKGPSYTVGIPATAGGDTLVIPRAAPLQAQHYSQADATFNCAIWDIFPFVKDGAVAPFPLAADKPFKTTDFTPENIASSVPAHEHTRISTNWTVLKHPRAVFHDYGFVGPTDLDKLENAVLKRKELATIEPVAQMVTRVESLKKEGNEYVGLVDMADWRHYKQRNWGSALWTYYTALMEMYPWTSTPLLFTAGDAFQYGVALLESQLWTNIATTAAKLASARRKEWHHVTIETAGVVINMRFTTHRLLAKAYKISSEAGNVLNPIKSLDWMRLPIAINLWFAHPPTAYSAIYSHIHLNDPKDGSWAHAKCHTQHLCMSDAAFRNMLAEKAQREGGLSIQLSNGESISFNPETQTFNATV